MIFSLQYRYLSMIPRVCWNGFLKLFHANISWLERPKFPVQLLQIPQKYLARGSPLFLILSVMYFPLYIARKCETRQTYKQTVKQLPRRQRFTYHTIMKLLITWSLLKHLNEANRACSLNFSRLLLSRGLGRETSSLSRDFERGGDGWNSGYRACCV